MAEFKSRRGTRETLKVAEVIDDRRLQVRPEGEDPKHVARLEQAIADKVDLPDIWVARIPEMGDHVIDGHQRLIAHRNKGKPTIGALVFKVDSFAEAKWMASPANADQHASPRTAEGKRQAVVFALEAAAEAGMNPSNRAVAEQCLVSHSFVAEVKKQLKDAEDVLAATAAGKTKGRDGVERGPRHEAKKVARGRQARPENEPSLDGTWRNVPLDEGGLNTSHHNLDAFRAAKCVTVGDVFDALIDGGIPKVAPFSAKGLLDQIQAMEGFDGVIPVHKAEKFDWVSLEAEYGSIGRRINVIAHAAGGIDAKSEAVIQAFRDAYSSYLSWKAGIVEREQESAKAQG